MIAAIVIGLGIISLAISNGAAAEASAAGESKDCVPFCADLGNYKLDIDLEVIATSTTK